MASPDELESELSKTMAELDELNSRDVTTNATSVLNCGLMVKFWSLKLQIAEMECHERRVDTASRHLMEWEKRKASAWDKRRLDELPKIHEAIEQFRRAGSLLEGLD